MKHIISIGSKDLAAGIDLSLANMPGVTTFHIPLPTLQPTDQVEEWIVTTFVQLSTALEGSVSGDHSSWLLNSIVVIGFYDDALAGLDDLNPISSSAGPLSVVIAMLVLAFPEVHWCFDTKHNFLKTNLFIEFHSWEAFNHAESLGRICGCNYSGYVPLFDPTGLRNSIRNNIKKEEENGVAVAPNIPVRPQLSAVIEEEEAYGYLHAYTAYKFGFRVNMITSHGMMKTFLLEVPSDSSTEPSCEDRVSLTFEDLYLNFPDRDSNLPYKLSRLPDRDQAFPYLNNIERRVIITTGHHGRLEDEETWNINNAYLKGRKARGLFIEMIFKPGAGIFDTWKRSKLADTLPNKGNARGYQLSKTIVASVPLVGGHSSPGRLLAIAKCLIDRSQRVRLYGSSSVIAAVYAATLALEAQEYLNERTPTTSLEALALKHESEVAAETLFYGIQYNIDLAARFKELTREVNCIGEWFKPKTKKVSKLNAEIRILTRLLGSFRENGQFDEEQKTLCRIRKLHRQLWRKRHQVWSWLVWVPRVYVEYLLGSLARFALAIGVWTLVFTIGYAYLLNVPSTHIGHESIWHGLTDGITAFFGMQPPHDFKSLMEEFPQHAMRAVLLTLGAILASFVHLGIFISHLYSMVSRR